MISLSHNTVFCISLVICSVVFSSNSSHRTLFNSLNPVPQHPKIAGTIFTLYLSSLSQLEAQLLVFLDYYRYYYYYHHHHHHHHQLNELALVDVIQTLHQGSEPYPMANTFLKILAVPNKAVFCSNPVLTVIPSLSSHVCNRLLTAPSAPTTTSTTSCCLIPHSFPISLFKFW